MLDKNDFATGCLTILVCVLLLPLFFFIFKLTLAIAILLAIATGIIQQIGSGIESLTSSCSFAILSLPSLSHIIHPFFDLDLGGAPWYTIKIKSMK